VPARSNLPGINRWNGNWTYCIEPAMSASGWSGLGVGLELTQLRVRVRKLYQ